MAGLTAFYTFRMIFLVFHGTPRVPESFAHAQESPRVMTIPLVVLAVGAVFAGFLNLPGVYGGSLGVSHWLAPSLSEQHPHASMWLELLAIATSVIAFAIGITFAYKKFGQGAAETEFKGLSKFAYHKFYVDEVYNAVFVQPYKAIGSLISRLLEPHVTDSLVKASVWLYRKAGNAFKILQVGYVRVYAIYMVIGLSLMSFFLSKTIN